MVINPYIFGGFDPDAQAFITNATITDTTQQNVINQLVLDLKSANIWTKMKAIYPFVGGTASQHRFNLKDPRPVSGAYYLNFYGGGTHSANGYQPDGATAYADTQFIPSGVLSQNSTHLSVYSRTNNNSATPLISSTDGANHLLNIWPRYSGTNDVYFRVNSSPTSPATTSATSTGLYIANRISSTETRNRINTTLVVQSATSTGLTGSNILLSRQGTAYDNREQAFATIGGGLSDSETLALRDAVNTYQIALSRNV